MKGLAMRRLKLGHDNNATLVDIAKSRVFGRPGGIASPTSPSQCRFPSNFRYWAGDTPALALKNFPKADWSEKFILLAISAMV